MAASENAKGSDLFNWVSEVWKKVLFQPDDEFAVNTFDKYYAKDIVIKLAASTLPRHISI
jgi:quinolinate synthase